MKRLGYFVLAVVAIGAALVEPGAQTRAQTSTPTATPSATPSPTPTATPTPTSPPRAVDLLRQSAAALKAVQWVHGDARLEGSSPGEALNLRITGDCGDLKTSFSKKQLHVTQVRGRVWMRGTVKQGGKMTHPSFHARVIVSKNSGTMWYRQDGTHKGWKSQKTNGNGALVEGFLVYICGPLLTSHVPASAFTTANSGGKVTSTTLRGTRVWKVTGTQRQGTTITTTATYVDQASLFWLRDATHQRVTNQNNPSQIVIDFSRYGQAVTITPPKG